MNWLWNNYLSSEAFSLYFCLFLCVWIYMCRKMGRKLLLGLEDDWHTIFCFSNYFRKSLNISLFKLAGKFPFLSMQDI